MWNLYRHDDIIKINRHPAVLGNGGQGGSFGNDNPLIPLEIDGEDHKKWRKLLNQFRPRSRCSPWRRRSGSWPESSSTSSPHAAKPDCADDFCVPLPSLTFLRLVGAPVEDLDFFLAFKDGVIHPEGDTVEEMDANMAVAGGKLLEYFVKFLAERRKETEQKDDVIAVLLRSEVDGEPIAELDLLNIMFLLMFAGLDTVTSSLSCIFAWLGQHPAERDRLIADRSLLPAAIEEIMRYESQVHRGSVIPRKTSTLATAWSSRRASPFTRSGRPPTSTRPIMTTR